MFASSEAERMRFYGVVLVLALFATTLSSAIPKPADDNDDHKAKHVVDKELSDEKHYEGEEHNTDYDHEAFLGKEESKTFDQLTPEESKERLGFLVTKIDKDGDGSVTEEELKDWIKHVQHRYIYKDTERQWKEHEATGDTLEWKTYHTRTYGFLNENDDDQNSYKDMIKRDERRWKKADGDGDGKLTKEEFAHFLHPEEAKHMQDIVVEETLEDIDKDKDGFISLEEYIGDFMEDEEDDDDDEDKEKREEPDWIKTERDVFKDQHDKNQDGNLDREEVRAWIIPDDYDHIESEAKHLLQNADIDKDGKLSKDEILEKYDVFVGSQATDFGEALTSHDEF